MSELEDAETGGGSFAFDVQVGEKEKMAGCRKCRRRREMLKGEGAKEARARCAR